MGFCHTCSKLNASKLVLVGVRSVGSPPRILLLRGSGSSSEDESPGSVGTPLLRCAVSFQVLSRFVEEVSFSGAKLLLRLQKTITSLHSR